MIICIIISYFKFFLSWISWLMMYRYIFCHLQSWTSHTWLMQMTCIYWTWMLWRFSFFQSSSIHLFCQINCYIYCVFLIIISFLNKHIIVPFRLIVIFLINDLFLLIYLTMRFNFCHIVKITALIFVDLFPFCRFLFS